MLDDELSSYDSREARVEAEMVKWDSYFAIALQGKGQVHEASFWADIADNDIIGIVGKYMGNRTEIAVCEPACGSGVTTHLLLKKMSQRGVAVSRVALVDLSENALSFARRVFENDEQIKRDAVCVEYVTADIFNLEMDDGIFDLVWNIGVIEHYTEEQICMLVCEMIRITKESGVTVIGIPNMFSVATLKAALLGSRFGRRFLSFIPGYRFDTEILYSPRRLSALIRESTGRRVDVHFAGSTLWVGAPTALVRGIHKVFGRSRFSFLAVFVIGAHDRS